MYFISKIGQRESLGVSIGGWPSPAPRTANIAPSASCYLKVSCDPRLCGRVWSQGLGVAGEWRETELDDVNPVSLGPQVV